MYKTSILLVFCAILVFVVSSTSSKIGSQLDVEKIVDLSHPLENNTIHWPTNKGFSYSVNVAKNFTNVRSENYFVKSDNIDTAIHCGTHLDAPVHFNEKGWTVDQIPLNRLVNVPAIVIDVSAKVKLNRAYSFQKSDFLDEDGNPLVEENCVVLVYTGVSKNYSLGAQGYSTLR